ncbi:MAG: hypothetical protein ABJE95_26835 [Byssovorax sp.]
MRTIWLAPLVVLGLVGLSVAACSATPGSSQFNTGGSGTGVTSADGSGGSGVGGTNFSGTGVGGSASTGGGSDCTEAAKLIYVLSTDNDLYSFNPLAKAFKKIGPLGCNTPMQPNSMAVDRDAVAYVNYVESDPVFGGDTAGAVYKVSTSDASCKPTPIQLGDGWFRLGMGFSSDAVMGTAEKLFITGTGATMGGSSPGLGRIDLGTNSVVPLGQFTGSLSGQNAELTGTGDARLFGFFTTSPVEVAEIDKGGAPGMPGKAGSIIMTTKLPKVETPAAWAFSFWGGDFYLYTAPSPATDPNRTTNVSRYRPSDGTTDPAYMTNIGFTIVGAGVSTCAPVKPPQ